MRPSRRAFVAGSSALTVVALTTSNGLAAVTPRDPADTARTVEAALDRQYPGEDLWRGPVLTEVEAVAHVHADLAGMTIQVAGEDLVIRNGLAGFLDCYDLEVLAQASAGVVSGVPIGAAGQALASRAVSRLPGYAPDAPLRQTTRDRFGYSRMAVARALEVEGLVPTQRADDAPGRLTLTART